MVRQGREILRAVQEHCTKPGYAVVMTTTSMTGASAARIRLAALVLRELREKFDLASAVMHSAMGQECYYLENSRNGQPQYKVRSDRRGKFDGYLRNVALNKVLSTNERWPFVLATPLHADVIVGIDVKHHTAGFTVVGKHGSQVRTTARKSRQKEMLLAEQVTTYLMELLRARGSVRRHSRHRAPPRRAALAIGARRERAARSNGSRQRECCPRTRR